MTPILVLLSLAFAQAPATPLRYDVPSGWIAKKASSPMRLADFELPKVEGDTENATLTVYHFGVQGGGGVQANLDRWISQMVQPNGRPSKEVARARSMKVGQLTLSLVALSGTYVAEKSPGSAERYNKPGFELRAAVVEGAGGPYYIKVIGPEKTVSKWNASVLAFLESLRTE